MLLIDRPSRISRIASRILIFRKYLTLHRDEYPLSYIVCIGPKSARDNDLEYFNPDMSSHAEKLEFSTIRVNGEIVTDIGDFVRQIVFDDIYSDGKSSGKGSIDKIILK